MNDILKLAQEALEIDPTFPPSSVVSITKTLAKEVMRLSAELGMANQSLDTANAALNEYGKRVQRLSAKLEQREVQLAVVLEAIREQVARLDSQDRGPTGQDVVVSLHAAVGVSLSGASGGLASARGRGGGVMSTAREIAYDLALIELAFINLLLPPERAVFYEILPLCVIPGCGHLRTRPGGFCSRHFDNGHRFPLGLHKYDPCEFCGRKWTSGSIFDICPRRLKMVDAEAV